MFPHRYSTIINDQNSIGWDQFLYGKIHKSIISNNHQYYVTNKTRYSGETWATRIIGLLWNYLIKLWNIRNQMTQDETKSPMWKKQQAETSIRALYAQQTKIDSSDHHMFTRPLTKILEMTPKQIDTVADRIRPRVAAAVARTKLRTKKSIQALKKFFPQQIPEHENLNDNSEEAITITKRPKKKKRKQVQPKSNEHEQQRIDSQKQPLIMTHITKYFHPKKHPKNDLRPP